MSKQVKRGTRDAYGLYAAKFTVALMNHHFASIITLYKTMAGSEASDFLREISLDIAISTLLAIFKRPDQKGLVSFDQIANLKEEMEKCPFKIIDGGGSLHLRLGALIEKQDRRRVGERAPFGGLSRALVQTGEDPGYTWLCENHREQFRTRSVSPSV